MAYLLFPLLGFPSPRTGCNSDRYRDYFLAGSHRVADGFAEPVWEREMVLEQLEDQAMAQVEVKILAGLGDSEAC